MTNFTFEGKGNSLDDAVEDLYLTMAGAANRKQHFVLPEQDNVSKHATDYVVHVRKRGSAFFAGEHSSVLNDAYQSALVAAGITDYDSVKHRLKVVGVYDLEASTPQPAAKGKPSGAAPSRSYGPRATDLF